MTSLSGASDVLAALGVKLDVPPVAVTRAIADAGVGFLWAPLYHPAMKTWAPIRADLGVRTLFNLLGPLCNPAGVKRQVLGVYDRRLVEPIAQVLKNLGSDARLGRAWRRRHGRTDDDRRDDRCRIAAAAKSPFSM